MRLKLYNFSKKHNSTKQLLNDAQPLATFDNVYLKQVTDIDSPVFLLDDTFRAANYAYLEDLGRYYFINKNRLGNNNIYEIDCELDTLATYKTYILAYEAFVERCADSRYYSPMFNDPLVSAKQEINNFDQQLMTIPEFSDNGTYILRVAGGDADGVSTYVTNNLSSWAAIFDQDTYLDSTTAEWWEKLGNIVFNPWDYIISLSWSPLKLSYYQSQGAYASNIWIKWFDTQISGYKLPNNKVSFITSNDFRLGAVYSDFRRFHPSFTQCKLYIPAIGLVDVDPAQCRGDLFVAYTIALDVGSCSVDLISRSNGLLELAHYEANLYVSMQAGSDAWQAGQVVGNLAGSIGGFASGDVMGGSSGLVQSTGSILVPMPSIIGGSGGAGIRGNSSIRYITLTRGSGDIPTAVAGRPCFRNLVLGNLEGFVKCGNASIELPANEAVKMSINNLLNEGIFIE